MNQADRRGISVVIAELTMVALAIAVSVAVIGYIQGWFKFSTAQSEGIYVYPDSVIVLDRSSDQVYADMHIYAKYKPYIKVVKVMLDKEEATSLRVVKVEQGGPVRVDEDGSLVLPVGTKAWVRAYFNVSPDDVVPDYGDRVNILIITNVGYVYKVSAKITVIGP